MREKHPIDDLFEKTLYNAEVTPPDAVRGMLGHRLGWAASTRNTSGIIPIVTLMLGLVGATVSVVFWSTKPGATVPTNGLLVEVAPVHANASLLETQEVEQGEPTKFDLELTEANVVGASRTENELTATSYPAGPIKEEISKPKADHSGKEPFVSSRSTAASNSDGKPYNRTETENANPTIAGGVAGSFKEKSNAPDGSVAVASTSKTPGSLSSTSANDPLLSLNEGLEIAGSRENTPSLKGDDPELSARLPSLDIEALQMAPLSIVPNIEVMSGRPSSVNKPLDYVLPRGTWWLGAYAGLGTVKGRWKGGNSEALDQSEKWRSAVQGGLLLSREWRSGLSFSTGIGVNSVRSVLKYDENGPANNTIEVDTTWASNVFADQMVYTWNIDTLLHPIPGITQERSARNSYLAVQIPLSIGWHKEQRRLRFGGFAGLAAWIPAQRKGSTLLNDRDAPPSIIALQDDKVRYRFAMQVHGMVGLTLGYAVTEHMYVNIEPQISSPLVGTGNREMPWLTMPTLQLRIQYAL